MNTQLIPNITEICQKLSEEARKKLLNEIISLSEKISEPIKTNDLGYLYCLRAASIDFDDIPDETTGMEEMALVTLDLLLKRLDYELYSMIYEGTAEKSFLDSVFVVYFCLVATQLASLIENSESNIKTIENYINVLKRKKALSATSNKWGDEDESAWTSILNEFVFDKIVGSSLMSLENEMPNFIKHHSHSCNINYISGRFVRAVYDENISKLGKNSFEIITGEDFEIHIKKILESNIYPIVVETTPRTGDAGADLIIQANNYTIVVQAKYYSGSVGNSAIQEVFSAKSIYQADFAVVVTNSQYTRPAIEAADTLDVVLTTEENIVEVIKHLIE